jgi:hypothetical protein
MADLVVEEMDKFKAEMVKMEQQILVEVAAGKPKAVVMEQATGEAE